MRAQTAAFLAQQEAVFLRAIRLRSSTARQRFVMRRCWRSPELRRCVSQLVARHERDCGLLDQDALCLFGTMVGEDQRHLSTRRASYAVGELLGHGGMSFVYQGRVQTRSSIPVAIKIGLPQVIHARSGLAVEKERLILSRLRHPGIVRLLDAGQTSDGLPFLVMELINGDPIHQACARNRWGLCCRLQLVEQLCMAVEQVHRCGVVHCDIKPANVLVRSTPQGVQTVLIDFGISRDISIGGKVHASASLPPSANEKAGCWEEETVVGSGSSATLRLPFKQSPTDDVIGTPGYMAPEQLLAHRSLIDSAADIYAVGALLYELLVGTPPVRWVKRLPCESSDPMQFMRLAQPLRLTEHFRQARLAYTGNWRLTRCGQAKLLIRSWTELDEIVMRCLAKRTRERFRSATELRMQLQRVRHQFMSLMRSS